MYEKTCRCGKSKKNFKMDIGPFYIAECCTEAGYDHNGKKVGDAVEQVEEANQAAAEQIIEDMAVVEEVKEEPKKKVSKKGRRKKKAE